MKGLQSGKSAQEVEKVFPDWVGEDEDSYKYLSIGEFEELTVEGIRELRPELQAKCAVLEKRITALETLVNSV